MYFTNLIQICLFIFIDCYASDSSSSSANSCACNRRTALRSNSHRYVSPEAHAVRIFKHPNSISKSENSTAKLLAIFLQPLDQTQNMAKKFRNKRDISRIFLRGGFKNNQVKRQDRLVKQYNKRLQSRAENANFFSKTPLPPKKKETPINRRPFEKLRNFLVPPRLRGKRDIKGEYDLIEKEREQLDLTLPEIIQYMPETLNPNFKRGPCQFSHLCELQEQQEQLPAMEANGAPLKEKVEEQTLENIEDKSNDSTGEMSENAISSSHKKRNANDYGCGLNDNSYNHQMPMPTHNPGYSFQHQAPPIVHPNHDARPRPFTVTANSYGIDPAPQQYVGAPQPSLNNNAPIVGAAYNPHHGQHPSNAQLDQIIADIVNRHSDFIEASTHPGGSLVDATKDQEYQTKSLLKNLWDGHWQKWFADEPLDNSHSYMPNYRAPASAPAYAPRSY